MKIKRQHFKRKMHMALCLLGFIPYLLAAYLFMNSDLHWKESIGLFAALVLVFHFAGFHILRLFSDELLDLVQESSGKNNDYSLLSVDPSDTKEVFHIKNNFNSLLQKLNLERENFNHITIQLLQESRKDSVEYKRRLKAIRPYVDQRVLQDIILEKESLTQLRSERKRVSILFVDICAFTRASEELEPDEIVDLLNDFFNVAVGIIYQNHGAVDKFIGDAIMATFGLGTPLHQVSVDAICAGLELQDAAKRLYLKRKKEGKKTFKVRVGINTGDVIAGDVGSIDRMDYTVIGDAVNVASRICDHAEAGGILISNHTYVSCRKYFKVETRGHIQVKNRKKSIETFAVIEKNERAFKRHDRFLMTVEAASQNFLKVR